ncbi:hypothetical protein [Fluviibacterium sp. S390]|uniref:hypothetical protein n=1 Tax=Fluviibacterium sp. S390 TaxID=3415139 RepID=UPI003C7CC813
MWLLSQRGNVFSYGAKEFFVNISEVDYTNREQVPKFFKTQPVWLTRLVVARNAARLLPLLGSTKHPRLTGEQAEELALACFRNVLVALVGAVEIDGAVDAGIKDRAMHGRNRTAMVDTYDIPHNAVVAAHVAAAAFLDDSPIASLDQTVVRANLYDASSELRADTEYGLSLASENGAASKLRGLKLWAKSTPHTDIAEGWEALRTLLSSRSQDWAFWLRWYEGLWGGIWTDWDLCHEIAMIAPEEWDKGPERIAELIRGIEAERLAEKLPQPETIIVHENENKFCAVPTVLDDHAIVETTLRQVEFANRTAMSSNISGYNSRCTAALYITYTLEECRNDPNAIEQNLDIARNDIASGMENGEFLEDPRLEALKSVLDRGVLDMRANHSVVAEAWGQRVAHQFAHATAGAKQEMVERTQILASATLSDLAKRLELDAQTTATESGEHQQIAARRLFGTVAKIGLALRAGGAAIQRVEASVPFSLIGLLQSADWLIGFATRLMAAMGGG